MLSPFSKAPVEPAALAPYANFLIGARLISAHVAFDAEHAGAAIAAPGASSDQPSITILMCDERGALWGMRLQPVDTGGAPAFRLRLVEDCEL